MNKAYIQLTEIWENRRLWAEQDVVDRVIVLLLSNGVHVRQDDGELKQVTISIPESLDSSYVLGLRYIKNDGTYTEDHFLCEQVAESGLSSKEIQPHYKRHLERSLPEYKHTHKQQPDFTNQQRGVGFLNDDAVTQVNTISFYIKD